MGAKFPNNDEMEADSKMEIDVDVPMFFRAWFLLVGMLVMTAFAFMMFVVWQLLGHFGVIA